MLHWFTRPLFVMNVHASYFPKCDNVKKINDTLRFYTTADHNNRYHLFLPRKKASSILLQIFYTLKCYRRVRTRVCFSLVFTLDASNDALDLASWKIRFGWGMNAFYSSRGQSLYKSSRSFTFSHSAAFYRQGLPPKIYQISFNNE